VAEAPPAEVTGGNQRNRAGDVVRTGTGQITVVYS
jgi:hypothetical protein